MSTETSISCRTFHEEVYIKDICDEYQSFCYARHNIACIRSDVQIPYVQAGFVTELANFRVNTNPALNNLPLMFENIQNHSSIAECAQACLNDSNCVGFTHAKSKLSLGDKDACYTIPNDAIVRFLLDDTNVVRDDCPDYNLVYQSLFVKDRNTTCAGYSYTYLEGFETSEGALCADVVGTVDPKLDTLDACYRSCYANIACMAFEFRSTNSTGTTCKQYTSYVPEYSGKLGLHDDSDFCEPHDARHCYRRLRSPTDPSFSFYASVPQTLGITEAFLPVTNTPGTCAFHRNDSKIELLALENIGCMNTCVDECVHDNACKSFDYNQHTKECHIYSMSASGVTVISSDYTLSEDNMPIPIFACYNRENVIQPPPPPFWSAYGRKLLEEEDDEEDEDDDDDDEDFSRHISTCSTDDECLRTLDTYCRVWWMDLPIPCMTCPNRGWLLPNDESALAARCEDNLCACRSALTRDEAVRFDEQAQTVWHDRERMGHAHWPGSSFCDQMVRQYANITAWSPLEAYVLNGCMWLRERGYVLTAFLRIPTLPPDLLYNPARIPYLLWELGRATALWFTLPKETTLEDRYARTIEHHMDPVMVHAWMTQLDRLSANVQTINVDGVSQNVSRILSRYASPEAGQAFWDLHMEAVNFTLQGVNAIRSSGVLQRTFSHVRDSIPHVLRVYQHAHEAQTVVRRAHHHPPMNDASHVGYQVSVPQTPDTRSESSRDTIARRTLLQLRTSTENTCTALRNFTNRLREPFEHAYAYYSSSGFRASVCQFLIEFQSSSDQSSARSSGAQYVPPTSMYGGICGGTIENPYEYPTVHVTFPGFAFLWNVTKDTLGVRTLARTSQTTAVTTSSTPETYNEFLLGHALSVVDWLVAPIPAWKDVFEDVKQVVQDLDDFARDPGTFHQTSESTVARFGTCTAESLRCERKTSYTLLSATLLVSVFASLGFLACSTVTVLRPFMLPYTLVTSLVIVPTIFWLAYEVSPLCYVRTLPGLPTCLGDDLYNQFYRYPFRLRQITWPSSIVEENAERTPITGVFGYDKLLPNSITDCKALGFRDGYHTLSYLLRDRTEVTPYLEWIPWYANGVRVWSAYTKEDLVTKQHTMCVMYTLPSLAFAILPYFGLVYVASRVASALLRAFVVAYTRLPALAVHILARPRAREPIVKSSV